MCFSLVVFYSALKRHMEIKLYLRVHCLLLIRALVAVRPISFDLPYKTTASAVVLVLQSTYDQLCTQPWKVSVWFCSLSLTKFSYVACNVIHCSKYQHSVCVKVSTFWSIWHTVPVDNAWVYQNSVFSISLFQKDIGYASINVDVASFNELIVSFHSPICCSIRLRPETTESTEPVLLLQSTYDRLCT